MIQEATKGRVDAALLKLFRGAEIFRLASTGNQHSLAPPDGTQNRLS